MKITLETTEDGYLYVIDCIGCQIMSGYTVEGATDTKIEDPIIIGQRDSVPYRALHIIRSDIMPSLRDIGLHLSEAAAITQQSARLTIAGNELPYQIKHPEQIYKKLQSIENNADNGTFICTHWKYRDICLYVDHSDATVHDAEVKKIYVNGLNEGVIQVAVVGVGIREVKTYNANSYLFEGTEDAMQFANKLKERRTHNGGNKADQAASESK